METNENGHPYCVYNPCIWQEEEGYYALSGSYWEGRIFDDCRMVQHLFFPQDLTHWNYLGPFGDKHILIFASELPSI